MTTASSSSNSDPDAILQQASPSMYALTSSASLDVENIAIPFVFVITMAMSTMLVSVWQSFLSVQLAKIGLNPSGGSLGGTFLVTAGIIVVTILLLKATKIISVRAAKHHLKEEQERRNQHNQEKQTTRQR